MAKASTQIYDVSPSHAEFTHAELEQITDWIALHKDSVTALLTLFDNMHEAGLLDIVNALIVRGQDLLKILADQAEKPEYAGGIKNVIALVQGFGMLDAKVLAQLMRNLVFITRNLDLTNGPKVAGVWSTLQAVRDPDVAAGFSVALAIIRGLGQGIRAEQEEGKSV